MNQKAKGGRENTSAIKVAITNLNGVENEIFNILLLHSPNTKSNYRHFESIVKCYRHFFSIFFSL